MAMGQWVRARQCRRDFNLQHLSEPNLQDKPSTNPNEKSIVGGEWTLEMSFFADMGGFRLQTKGQDPFPIDARQLLYLVRKGYIQQPVFKPRMIEDKNKVDGLLRIIILCQVSWFLIGVIGRWVQHLVVTTAELTTVSFILCSTITTIFWWHKPADVVMAEIINIDIDINDILTDADQPLDAWKMTPLDFASREEWWWSKAWCNFVNILTNMHISFGSASRPIDRISDSSQRSLRRREQYLFLFITAGCFAIFFVAWNDEFPNAIERTLWRAVCVVKISLVFIMFVFHQIMEAYNVFIFRRRTQGICPSPLTPQSRVLDGMWTPPKFRRLRHVFRRLDKALDGVRNNSPDEDPELYVPLRVILPLYICGFTYFVCRGYILIEDAIALRSLPPKAYETVKWDEFWPHFG
ncbi:MAG: hypothetical protein Q9174_005250 [Haloplaca sp. 1 TL-2023]